MHNGCQIEKALELKSSTLISEAQDRVRIPAGLGNPIGQHKYNRLSNREITMRESPEGHAFLVLG